MARPRAIHVQGLIQNLPAVDLIDACWMGRLDAFGRLIGHSDRHQGSLGFHLVDQGPLAARGRVLPAWVGRVAWTGRGNARRLQAMAQRFG